MSRNAEIDALQNRYDFLFDAYVQGMCDGHEVEDAGRKLREAIDAAILESKP